MLKRFVATALGISSAMSLSLPAQAQTGDWAYPVPFRNYLSQLARESDWIREGPFGLRHYHFIATAPLGRLVALANVTCAQMEEGRPYATIKADVEADAKTMFPSTVITKLGASGVSRFADVAIGSAVKNTCPTYSSSLPTLNYTLPAD
ncbi:hypothetical protein [Trichocoleus sp. FACHB-262]|uniref:hypothetical protein n=1 Tax=Trichocoleus sp. FACHB-262 TaxID=2692869 RepID=UPI001689E86C|nr:hypothetical protein [Trichocoleus sp. FACHB-262]MBD2124786.1 hypothetical protein [Trichocoleus sp. FACHB-262]